MLKNIKVTAKKSATRIAEGCTSNLKSMKTLLNKDLRCFTAFHLNIQIAFNWI
jgi:hypothetical protein